MKNLAEQILNFREANDLTQNDLAKMIGGKCQPANISNWEHGKSNPNGTNLIKLLKAAKRKGFTFKINE